MGTNLQPSLINWKQLARLEPRLVILYKEAEQVGRVLRWTTSSYNVQQAYEDLFQDRLEAMVGPNRLEAETVSMRRTGLPAQLLDSRDIPCDDTGELLAVLQAMEYCRRSPEERMRDVMDEEQRLLLSPEALEVAFGTIYNRLMGHWTMIQS